MCGGVVLLKREVAAFIVFLDDGNQTVLQDRNVRDRVEAPIQYVEAGEALMG
jgi:hypothetical protein